MSDCRTLSVMLDESEVEAEFGVEISEGYFDDGTKFASCELMGVFIGKKLVDPAFFSCSTIVDLEKQAERSLNESLNTVEVD